MKKDSDLHIKITDELLKKIETLALKDRRKKTEIATIALENYFKLRKI